MSNNLKFLFQYLKKINIPIDQDEFAFQMQSHPDFPSLLSIADTLSFFNINNEAIHVSIRDLEQLPNHFVSLLKEDDKASQLYYIERKGINYYCFNGKEMKLISQDLLSSKWNNIVLLAEKLEVEVIKDKKAIPYILPLLCFIFFLIVVSQFKIIFTLFFTLPISGLILSIVALKDLFGVKSEFANNFCNFAVSTSCSEVVDSDKWKILKLINFSDLSIFLFSSQFLGLFIFLLSGNLEDFFSIQRILLLVSLPVIFMSLYYQKFVEKKWCPICLMIISIIFFELVYLLWITKFSLFISLNSLVLYGLVFFTISYTWFISKKLLITQKELKEFQFKGHRFMRNYEIFKNTLVIKSKITFPEVPIVLGNVESDTVITLISSPFCKYCKATHEILDEILRKHSKNLCIQIILKTDLTTGSEENSRLFRTLYNLYSFDIYGFTMALKEWYDNPNLKDWLKKYGSTAKDNFDEIMEIHNNWCKINEINYTPTIYINGYEYPKLYDNENLEYFINELIEDTF